MASLPSRFEKCRSASFLTTSRPIRPVQAERPLPMTLVTSFDQRSPHIFSVTKALSALARRPQTSLARSVMRPCTSPTRERVVLRAGLAGGAAALPRGVQLDGDRAGDRAQDLAPADDAGDRLLV